MINFVLKYLKRYLLLNCINSNNLVSPFFKRIAKTLTFSTNGHGIYFASPFEIQKFTINAAFKDIIPDMVGSLYVNKEMPEPPKQGFFKGLFSTGSSALDREELCKLCTLFFY